MKGDVIGYDEGGQPIYEGEDPNAAARAAAALLEPAPGDVIGYDDFGEPVHQGEPDARRRAGLDDDDDDDDDDDESESVSIQELAKRVSKEFDVSDQLSRLVEDFADQFQCRLAEAIEDHFEQGACTFSFHRSYAEFDEHGRCDCCDESYRHHQPILICRPEADRTITEADDYRSVPEDQTPQEEPGELLTVRMPLNMPRCSAKNGEHRCMLLLDHAGPHMRAVPL